MRIAFIGGNGHHNLNHWVAKTKSELGLEIAAASDGYDATSAQSMAKRVGAEHWYDTPQEILDEFTPDIVSIGAVYGHNGTIAAMALERDIPVVMDKPVAATWQQLEKLHELTAGTDRKLITEFMFRTWREVRAARQAIADGRIGKVALITAQKSYRFGDSRPAWYANRADYAGTMLWVASHMIDAVQYCSGLKYGRVVGLQANLTKPDYGTMEDFCVAMFEMSNGAGTVVHADYLRPAGAPTHGDDRMRIAGASGLIELSEGQCLLIEGNKAQLDITDSVPAKEDYEFLLEALNGQSTDVFSTAESLEIAEVLLRARDAADQRTWIG